MVLVEGGVRVEAGRCCESVTPVKVWPSLPVTPRWVPGEVRAHTGGGGV